MFAQTWISVTQKRSRTRILRSKKWSHNNLQLFKVTNPIIRDIAIPRRIDGNFPSDKSKNEKADCCQQGVFSPFLWLHVISHRCTYHFLPFACVARYYVTQTMKSNFQPNKWFYRNNAPYHLYPLIRNDIRKSIPKFAMQVTNVHYPHSSV